MPKPKADTLTKKQEDFAVAVAKGDKASDAYRAAYDCANMADKTIHEKASRLAAGDKVRARIDELRAPALKRHGITVDRTLEELASVGYAETEAPKASEKVAALDKMMKHLGLYKEDNNQKTAPVVAINISLVE